MSAVAAQSAAAAGGEVSTAAPRPLLSVVTLVNQDRLYEAARGSLAVQHADGAIQWLPIRPNQRGWNAAEGLNAGIDAAQADWIICAHQDVLFPKGWWTTVEAQLAGWGPRVAVAGLVGVRDNGRFAGHILDPHGHCRWGPLPVAIGSLDEHLLILRRASGLRFDPATPGFHCYGTDLAREARRRGFDAIAIDAPVIHLSGGKLDPAFDQAAEWLLRKWGRDCGGVLPTCAKVIAARRWSNGLRRLLVRWNRRISRIARDCRCGVFRRMWTGGGR